LIEFGLLEPRRKGVSQRVRDFCFQKFERKRDS